MVAEMEDLRRARDRQGEILLRRREVGGLATVPMLAVGQLSRAWRAARRAWAVCGWWWTALLRPARAKVSGAIQRHASQSMQEEST